MRFLVLAAAVLAACDPQPVEWRGMPQGVKPACSWEETPSRVGHCVGGGVAYLCVHQHGRDLDIIECAPLGTLTPVRLEAP